MEELCIKDGETILFIGDSITDCGRRGPEAPLGNGYVRIFSEVVTARFPERNIQYINKGIGGNRVTDLRGRWQDDVLMHRPDWLSIKIGINDLHTHLRDPASGVSPELFAEIYDSLLRETQDKLDCQIVLIDPFYIYRGGSGEEFQETVLGLMPEYIETVHLMSEKYGTRLVHTHDVFQRHLQYRDANAFCPEPVHPYRAGHVIIAEELLEVLST